MLTHSLIQTWDDNEKCVILEALYQEHVRHMRPMEPQLKLTLVTGNWLWS